MQQKKTEVKSKLLPLYNPTNSLFEECLCSAQPGCRPLWEHRDRLRKVQERKPENRSLN